MKRGVAFFHSHENPAAGRANFSAGGRAFLPLSRDRRLESTTFAERKTESFVGVGRNSLIAYSAVTVQGA